MQNIDWKARHGDWALIAGGSEGIGRAFADRLAAAGVNLILLARKIAPLQTAASEIKASFGVQVEIHSLDLISADLSKELDRIVGDREIGTLIYNAGASTAASFLNESLEHSINIIRVNCDGPTTFVHKLAPAMCERKRGAIILVSSMSCMAGAGYVATYAASKAYETTLAEALWIELGDQGVSVLGLLTGATATPAMERAGVSFSGASTEDVAIDAMNPYDVADEALAALGTGPVLAPGSNRGNAELLRSIPRKDAIMAMTDATANLYNLPPLKIKRAG